LGLAGCDDPDNGKPKATGERHSVNAPARLGDDWLMTAQTPRSAWSFAPGADSLDAIRSAIGANALPPRDGVKVAALVNRVSSDVFAAAGSREPGLAVVLTDTPWNEDTILLWVAIASVPPSSPSAPPEHPAVAVVFDPRTVQAYRPLGDPTAIPPGGGATPAAMLYELSLQRGIVPTEGLHYGTVEIHYPGTNGGPVERLVTEADSVDSIEDAPEIVRFAAAVAGFGGLLRGDPAVRDLSCDDVVALAKGAAEPDPSGVRAELIGLMERAEPLIDEPSGDAPGGDEPPHDQH
jgi:hypothetical protein